MLVELKRCNSIGNIDGILFLVTMLSKNSSINRQEVTNRCALERSITIHSAAAVAFLEYLGYVSIDGATIFVADAFSELLPSSSDHTISILIKSCISKLTEDGVFDTDSFYYNTDKGKLAIKRIAFPLTYAAIRNFLIAVGAFSETDEESLYIGEEHENTLITKIRRRKQKISLEQLLKQQEQQSKQGYEAEEYVLSLEKLRVPEKSTLIKRISDLDVSAGYDIVSFQSKDCSKHDRFIEVKSYQGEAHFFWSANEVEIAKIKGDRYWLCLVNYDNIHDPDYTPQYIQNPYDVIFSDAGWLVETSSYKIKKV